MNKNLLIGLGVILVTIVVGGLFLNQKEEKVIVKNTPEVMIKKETPKAVMKNENKKYVEYSDPSTLDIESDKKVLFFYANWCPTCIPVDSEFDTSENQIPEGLVIIRVNYNDPDTDSNEKELARKYGITYQHTFVQIDGNGEAVTKWNGGGLSELVLNLK